MPSDDRKPVLFFICRGCQKKDVLPLGIGVVECSMFLLCGLALLVVCVHVDVGAWRAYFRASQTSSLTPADSFC